MLRPEDILKKSRTPPGPVQTPAVPALVTRDVPIQAGLQLIRLQDQAVLWTAPSCTSSTACSPDGKLLAALCQKSVSLLRVEDGSPVRTLLTTPLGDHYALAFSPDGQILAIGGYDDARPL
jgi:hypothetical protein